jgi:hypothetical protein
VSAIILPRRFNQQPQYPAPLDAGHWAARDIVFAFSAGRGFKDGKHPELAGTLTSFTTFAFGTKGKYLQNTVPGNNAYFSNSTDHDTLGGVTILGLVQPSSVSGQMTIASKDTGGGGTNTPFGLLLDAGGVVSLNRANAGFRVWNGVAGITAGQTAVVAATQGADISVPPKFYIDGRFDTGSPVNQFGGSGSGAPIATSEGIKLTANTAFGNRFLGGIYGVLVLNKEYSASQVAELSRNLWAIWKAQPRRIWAVPVSGYTLTADPGSFGVTGTTASLKYGRVLQAASGSFAVTGTAAELKKGYRLQADSGSFGLSGTDATLKHNRVIQASAGSFQVSGTDASLKYGRVLQADPGAFQITGTDATLTYGTAGSYTLTAQSGSFSVSGAAATLRYGRKLSADSGSFAFTGTAATLRYARRVIAESGTFSLTGTAATLTYSGAAGPVTSTVERTAIFRAIVARSTKFQRSKSVTVRFN